MTTANKRPVPGKPKPVTSKLLQSLSHRSCCRCCRMICNRNIDSYHSPNIGSSRLRTGSCRIKSELVFGQITALILTGAFIDQPDLTSRLLRTQNQTSPSAQPSLCRCKPTASRCKLCPPACPPPARRSRGLSTSIFTRARRSSHVAVHGGRAQSTRALICFCRR